jgi:predicted nucleotide-binding protein
LMTILRLVRRERVMVVYGRDDAASVAMFDYLRALKLEPQEWGDLVRASESGAPYTGEVLDRALEIAQAVIVLFTPDDEARLKADLIRDDDSPVEGELRGQPRPNVLFEAGLAFGRHPKRTSWSSWVRSAVSVTCLDATRSGSDPQRSRSTTLPVV